MSWPEESTLRAILTLPGVAGTTRADIEKYLAEPERWQRHYYADRPSEPDEHAEPDAHREWRMRDSEWKCQFKAAARLRADMEQAVQSHWHQLIEAKVI